MKENFQERTDKAKALINNAECILIGGGAGLSAAAGLTYSGERFTANFADFIRKYGMKDMYSAGFYPFETQEEKWAYWCAISCSTASFRPPCPCIRACSLW